MSITSPSKATPLLSKCIHCQQSFWSIVWTLMQQWPMANSYVQRNSEQSHISHQYSLDTDVYTHISHQYSLDTDVYTHISHQYSLDTDVYTHISHQYSLDTDVYTHISHQYSLDTDVYTHISHQYSLDTDVYTHISHQYSLDTAVTKAQSQLCTVAEQNHTCISHLYSEPQSSKCGNWYLPQLTTANHVVYKCKHTEFVLNSPTAWVCYKTISPGVSHLVHCTDHRMRNVSTVTEECC